MHGEGEIVVVVALLRPGSIRGKIEKKPKIIPLEPVTVIGGGVLIE